MATDGTMRRYGAARALGAHVVPAPASVLQYQTLAVLWIAAGSSGVLTLAAGVDAAVHRPSIMGLALTAIAIGLVMLVLARRLSPHWFMPVLCAAVVLITGAVLASGEADTPYVMFYFWAAAESWYFLRPRTAAILTVLTALAGAAAMAFIGRADGDALTWWIMISATLLAVSGLAGVLRLRSESLIGELQGSPYSTRSPGCSTGAGTNSASTRSSRAPAATGHR